MPRYDDLNREELIRLLEQRDRREAIRFGLVWEAKERDSALNDDFVALDLDDGLSCGTAPWRNLIVEGDNYDALRHLRMAFAGRVKCIYIDPPYNTGNRDFVYNDRFVDREDAWRHSKWCDFMFRRLQLAKRLLAPDGAIFVSIDDNECATLRLLMDKVFGAENFLASLVWEKGKKGDSKFFSVTHEYILVYAASRATLTDRGMVWRRRKEGIDEVLVRYATLRRSLGEDHERIRAEMQKWFRSLPASDPAKKHKHYGWSDARGLYFAADFSGPDDGRASRPRYDILHPVTGKPCKKPSTGWRWEEERTRKALAEDPPRIHFGPDETTIPCRKSYLADVDAEPFSSVFYKDGRAATLEVEALIGKGEFSFPKDSEIIEELISLCTGPDDLVLDFFAGSGTTAHAVHKLNAADGGRRRCILVSNTEATKEAPEKNLCRDVCARRVRRVIEGYNGAPGLGGDFAYLRCRRVASGRLLRLDHEAVWTALQLVYRDRLAPHDRAAPYQFAEDDGAALVYVPRFRVADAEGLRRRLDAVASAAVFSWQPEALRQRVHGDHIEHESAAEFLARKFTLS